MARPLVSAKSTLGPFGALYLHPRRSPSARLSSMSRSPALPATAGSMYLIHGLFWRRSRSPSWPDVPTRRLPARSCVPLSGVPFRTPTSRAWRTTPTVPSVIRSRAFDPACVRHLRAGAVPWSDARLQGSGDAIPVAPDGLRAGAARRALHHRGRDIGRHRRRGRRGLPRQQQVDVIALIRMAASRRCSAA